jgi:hypothetical protein
MQLVLAGASALQGRLRRHHLVARDETAVVQLLGPPEPFVVRGEVARSEFDLRLRHVDEEGTLAVCGAQRDLGLGLVRRRRRAALHPLADRRALGLGQFELGLRVDEPERDVEAAGRGRRRRCT